MREQTSAREICARKRWTTSWFSAYFFFAFKINTCSKIIIGCISGCIAAALAPAYAACVAVCVAAGPLTTWWACFANDTVVITPSGKKFLLELSLGDKVKLFQRKSLMDKNYTII